MMNPVGEWPVSDAATVAGLYETERNRVFAVCFAMLRNVEDAEDATQETFVRIVAHVDSLHGDARPYLVTTARNVCIDELRRRARRHELASDAQLRAHAGQTIEDSAVSRDMARLAWRRLAEPEQKVVAYLFAGMSPSEIGARLGTSAGLVSVRLFRARQRLRRLVPAPAFLATARDPRLVLDAVLRRLRSLRSDAAGPLMARLQEGGAGVIPTLMSVVVGGMGGGAAAGGVPAVAMHGAVPSPVAAVVQNAAATLRHDLAAVAARANPAVRAPHGVAMWFPTFYPSAHYQQDHTMLATTPQAGPCGSYAPCYALYRSSNGGRSWTVAGYGLVGQLLVPTSFPASPVLYALRPDGLARSADGGRSFELVKALVDSASSAKDQARSQAQQGAAGLPSALAPVGMSVDSTFQETDQVGAEVKGDVAAVDPASPAGDERVYLLHQSTGTVSVYDRRSGSLTPVVLATPDQVSVGDVFTGPGAPGVYLVVQTADQQWLAYLCVSPQSCSRLGPAGAVLQAGVTRVSSPTFGADRTFWMVHWDGVEQVTLSGQDVDMAMPAGWYPLTVLPDAHYQATRRVDMIAVRDEDPSNYRMLTSVNGGPFRVDDAPSVPVTVDVSRLQRLADGRLIGTEWSDDDVEQVLACSSDDGRSWATAC